MHKIIEMKNNCFSFWMENLSALRKGHILSYENIILFFQPAVYLKLIIKAVICFSCMKIL